MERDLSQALETARIAWLAALSTYCRPPGFVQFPAMPMLTRRHLERCQIFCGREEIIRHMRQGGKAAELGVGRGDFSQVILDACHPKSLHLIDVDLRRQDVARRFSEEIAGGRVLLNEGNSSSVIGAFPDKHFDFIYFDADHSYAGVWRDIGASMNKVKDDGFLIFNDYTCWSPCECMPYGVMQAVNEFCIQNDWEAVYFALGPLMYCDIAIRRRLA